MKSIRIGNDIRIEWPIVLSGDVSKLQELDLTVEVRPSAKVVDWHNYIEQPTLHQSRHSVMMNGGIAFRPDIGDGKEHCPPHRPKPAVPYVRLPYHIEDNTLIAMWTADRQFAVGDYDIILYAHKNKGGQAVCDQYRFARLVSHTAQADAPDDSGIEAVIAMQPVTIKLAGLSAYEVAVINGFNGTEEEWLESLKQPAEDAAEQAKEELEQFKTDAKNVIDKNLSDLKEQEAAVIDAKEKALSEIETTKQDAIADFSAQRVTPEMLSESVRQLIENSGEKTITNLPDDEDLYTTGGDTPVLKFKDKAYNPSGFSGLATKILRKNILGSKNVLAQEMVSDANTIYEIRYDFDLNGATIIIPDNCVLKFNGGSLDNGTIEGTKTGIEASPIKIFGENIDFSGYFLLNCIYAEWFGAQSYLTKNLGANQQNFWNSSVISAVQLLPDCAPAFNKALELAGKYTSAHVKACGTIYNVSSTIEIPCETCLETEESTLFLVFMQGDGLTVVTHNDNYEFSKEALEENAYTLAMDQFIDTSSMAVAFHMGPRRTSFIGRGTIALNTSRYTIGLLITGETYGGVDVTFQSPKVDMRFCGGEWGQKAIDTGTQILSEDPTDDTLNETGRILYAWNKNTKILYTKANNSSSWVNNGTYDNYFNTSLRIDIGNPSVTDYRLMNPDITINDGRGFRGLEVYIHDGGWFNISKIRGSISYKHGHYVSVYSNMEMASHDWSELEHQVDWQQRDCRLFYAKRCVDVRLGRSHDLPFSNLKDHAYYLGKGTRGVWIKDIHGLANCVEDHGIDNVYFQNDTTFNRFCVNFRDDNAILGRTFYNALDGRTPSSANLLNNNNNLWANRFINEMPPEDDYESLFSNINSRDVDMSYCFDGDVSTKERVIDIGNGIYGVVMRFLYGNANSVLGASFSHGWIEIDYKISGISTFNEDAIIVIKQYYQDVEFVKRYLTYNQYFVQKIFLPYSNNIDIAFVAQKNTIGLKLDIYAIKYYANTVASDYFDSNRMKFRDIIKNGFICMLPTSPQLMFNYGDAKDNNFYTIKGNRDTFETIIKTSGKSNVNMHLTSKYYDNAYFEHLNIVNGISVKKSVSKEFSRNTSDNRFKEGDFTINSTLDSEYYHIIRMMGISFFQATNVYGDIASILKNCNSVKLTSCQIYGRDDISKYVENISHLDIENCTSINSIKMNLNIASLKSCNNLVIGTSMKLYGNIADLLTRDKNNFSMNIWNLGSIDVSELTYNTVPHAAILPTSLNSFQIYASSLALTTSMVDALLIDMAYCIKTGGSVIYLPNKRTAASDDAVAALEELGFTVNVPLQAEE